MANKSAYNSVAGGLKKIVEEQFPNPTDSTSRTAQNMT